jgi:hypothetical protein
MKTLFILMNLIFTTSALASRNPYCEDHRKIKTIMVKINQSQVDQVLPNAAWLDEKFRKKDQIQAAGIVGKTVVLLLLKRLSALSYVFEPTRLGVGTFTGMYISNPENFSKFLELPTARACQYLSMSGRESDTLRDLTHEVWINLSRARH